MKIKDRQGNTIIREDGQEKTLNFLYGTFIGRMLLKILIKPGISKMVGKFLDSYASKIFIKSFIKKNNIDMTQFENKRYKSYNDFFYRKIAEGARVIDTVPEHFIAPCDSKLSVYPITEDGTYKIKNTEYTMKSLTKSEKTSKYYEGGYIFVFRLTVDDYHRYCFADGGTVTKKHKIPGVLHTVNPIANDKYPIYKENSREYCFLKSDNFNTLLIMEVGALLVGKIVNHEVTNRVSRGDEKGRFEFGGSTVILCVKKDVLEVDKDIIKNSEEGFETIVKMGERIAICK